MSRNPPKIHSMPFFTLIFLFHSVCGAARPSSPRFIESQQHGQEDAFQRGLTALKENRMEDALAEFTAAEREHPENARIRNFRGILLVQTGKNRDAAAEYQEAIRLDPQLEDAYRNLGFLRWTEHNLDQAREALRRAVELSPDDPLIGRAHV